ncbi:MAG TPA: GNAT family N-acetyltransferase, partial [Bacillota bacterium]|nr:GNAT family N-acetyltransferase [Bacillota bacterium]
SSSPVGYLEGICVVEGHRRKGVAKKLLKGCEDWVRSKGLVELASDCELTNKTSIAFHEKLGFKEANRVVCFVKDVDE